MEPPLPLTTTPSDRLSGYRNCPMGGLLCPVSRARIPNLGHRRWNVWGSCGDQLSGRGALRPTVGPEDQGHGLHAGMESQLAHEALHVALGGERADPQLVGDLARGLAGQSSQDLGVTGP